MLTVPRSLRPPFTAPPGARSVDRLLLLSPGMYVVVPVTARPQQVKGARVEGEGVTPRGCAWWCALQRAPERRVFSAQGEKFRAKASRMRALAPCHASESVREWDCGW